MTGENKVKIELNEQEAELFEKFRRNQKAFEKLIDSKALDVENGSITLHFNSSGQLMKIEQNGVLYNENR